jgi:hypothetical protein
VRFFVAALFVVTVFVLHPQTRLLHVLRLVDSQVIIDMFACGRGTSCNALTFR